MRTLIVAAVVLLAVGTTSPALATSVAASSAGPSVVARGLSDVGDASSVRAKKKKKSSSKYSASFQEVGNARRGKKDLEIKIKVSKANLGCVLKVAWKNGKTSSDDVDSDEDKICEFSIGVPNGKDAVGDAKATVTVYDGAGKKVASAKKTFPVK